MDAESGSSSGRVFLVSYPLSRQVVSAGPRGDFVASFLRDVHTALAGAMWWETVGLK